MKSFFYLALMVCVSFGAGAVNPAIWNVNEETTGNDVFYNPSSPVLDNDYPVYEFSFEILKVEVNVTIPFFGSTWVNVTDQLGTNTTGSTTSSNGLPVQVLDDTISYEGIQARVQIGVNAGGFAEASITDVQLGVVQGQQVNGLRVEAMVTGLGIFVPPPPFFLSFPVNQTNLFYDLSWEAKGHYYYQLQSNVNLLQSNSWMNVGPVHYLTNDVTVTRTISITNPTTFFRVNVVEP